MEKSIKEKVIILFFVQLTMKCIFKKEKKSTLSIFDDKRFYTNETESKPWIYFMKLVHGKS